MQLITFALGEWTFGMPLASVQEVQKAGELESVSLGERAPSAVLRLRGESLPVWDLRALLRLPPGPPARDRFLLVTADKAGRRVWLVDAATEVLELSAGQPVAITGTPMDAYVSGVLRFGPTLVFLLDPAKLVAEAQAAPAPLATPDAAAPPAEELVVFVVGWQRYALPVGWIREIQPVGELTPIPCVPAFVRGLMNLRGGLLSVIDLHDFLGVQRPGMEEAARVIVLDAPDLEIGLAAREVVGLRRVPPGGKLPPMPAPGGVPARFLAGMLDDFTLVLDAHALLSDPKLIIDAGALR